MVCTESRDRPVEDDEIEVTPEMVEAGVDAICESFLDSDPYADIAVRVYIAMRRVAVAPNK